MHFEECDPGFVATAAGALFPSLINVAEAKDEAVDWTQAVRIPSGESATSSNITVLPNCCVNGAVWALMPAEKAKKKRIEYRRCIACSVAHQYFIDSSPAGTKIKLVSQYLDAGSAGPCSTLPSNQFSFEANDVRTELMLTLSC